MGFDKGFIIPFLGTHVTFTTTEPFSYTIKDSDGNVVKDYTKQARRILAGAGVVLVVAFIFVVKNL